MPGTEQRPVEGTSEIQPHTRSEKMEIPRGSVGEENRDTSKAGGDGDVTATQIAASGPKEVIEIPKPSEEFLREIAGQASPEEKKAQLNEMISDVSEDPTFSGLQNVEGGLRQIPLDNNESGHDETK